MSDDAGIDDARLFAELAAAPPAGRRYVLRLYVAGTTPRSTRAIQSIKQVCEERLEDRYELDVIDIFQQPARAQTDQIVAVPTLVKLEPGPRRVVIGDLSNREKLLRGLDLQPASPA